MILSLIRSFLIISLIPLLSRTAYYRQEYSTLALGKQIFLRIQILSPADDSLLYPLYEAFRGLRVYLFAAAQA